MFARRKGQDYAKARKLAKDARDELDEQVSKFAAEDRATRRSRSFEEIIRDEELLPDNPPPAVPSDEVSWALALFGRMGRSEGGVASLIEQKLALDLFGIEEEGVRSALLDLFPAANRVTAEYHSESMTIDD